MAETICLFSRCRPRNGSNANSAYENPRLMKKRYQEDFYNPLQNTISSIDPGENASSSPILETLRAVGNAPGFSGAQKCEIHIFSNLLENSFHVNHYGSGWENFEDLLSKSLRVLDTRNLFAGADVTVFLLPDSRQNRIHTDWWRAYFEYTGVSTFKIKRL